MRSVRKLLNSKAFALIYSLTNGKKNKKIREILLKEQKKICAYTESYIGREDGGEIDHFNPELKGKPEDGYHNYFVIKSQWNKEKNDHWDLFQPILHPTDEELEKRICFNPKEARFYTDPTDLEANNLVNFLNLNDPDLIRQRKLYLERKRKEIERFKESPEEHFKTLLIEEPKAVYYIRAINETFNINVFNE